MDFTVPLMELGRMPFPLQKEILKHYPKSVSCCDEWLVYLNKLEEKLTAMDDEFCTNSVRLMLYERAITVLKEDWSNESYLVIFLRRAILAFQDPDVGSILLSLCAINARSNPQMIAALVNFYYKQGDHGRVETLINRAEKSLDADGVRLLHTVRSLLRTDGDIKTLLGSFYYEIDTCNMDIHSESKENRVFLERNRSNLQHTPHSNILLKSTLRTHTEPIGDCKYSPIATGLRLSGDPDMCSRMSSKRAKPDRSAYTKRPVMAPETVERASIFTDSYETVDQELTNITSVWDLQSDSGNEKVNRFSHGMTMSRDDNFYGSMKSSPFHNSQVQRFSEHNALREHSRTVSNLGISASSRNTFEIFPRLRVCDVGVQASFPDDSLPGILTVNHENYYVIAELGRGGSSVVYWALDSTRNSRAIKVVDLNNASVELITSYVNEIDLLKSLSNYERVIHLFDFERRPESLLLVMECANSDLEKVLQRMLNTKNQIPSCTVLFYWDQMLRCVKTLHDRRIVHLDLKPQNFVLVNGELKLIDLGISKRLPDNCTRVEQSLKLGTLSFMSPEQLEECTPCYNQSSNCSPGIGSENRTQVGCKSDIWSLGVILYVMVYAQLPFRQHTIQSRILAILNPNAEIQFPPIRNAAIHKALKRSLVRDFRKRATVNELLSYEYEAVSITS